MAGIYPCRNVDLVAQVPEGSATDIWGWTDPETGVEYAIIFIDLAATFVDLRKPSAPVVAGRITSTGGQDARTYEDHLYFVGDRIPNVQGIAIFDLTQLRTAEYPSSFAHDGLYSGIRSSHNIDLNTNSGYAYPALGGGGTEPCSGALHVVDVREPLNPTFAGCFDPGYRFHDVHCVTYDGPDADYVGREICFGSAGSEEILSIVDVTDKAAPSLIAEVPYPNAYYTHQGWLTEDHRYFIAGDEADENAFGIDTRTVVFDVSDLDEATFAFEHFAETPATDHNLFVKGDFAYQVNYAAGLRVLDLSAIDEQSLTEVAYFDTYPEGDESGTKHGAWGVYPFFESGIIVVSDRDRGLFVLRPTFEGVVGTEEAPATSLGLKLAAYPNPFGSASQIELRLEAAQHVTITVYDVLGRRVAEVFGGELTGDGPHRFTLDAADLPTGTYLVRAMGEVGTASHVVTRAHR